MRPRLLVIGGSGQTGLALIRAAAQSPLKPAVHVFARTPNKVPRADAALTASIEQGDARSAADIERALEETKADIVVVSVASTSDLRRETDVRAASAKALMDVIEPGSKYEHVRVVVVSTVGAGGTKIDIGFGIGLYIRWRLRHVLKDHDAQEKEIWDRLGEEHKKRCWVVHTTELTVGKTDGEVQVFEGRVPSPKIDRSIVARYIIDEVCAGCPSFGKAVSITTKRS